MTRGGGRSRSRARTSRLTAALLVPLALLAGCSASPTGQATTAAPGDDLRGTLRVYAAASLRTAFDDLTAEFATDHPGVDVKPVVYDGSSVLATQIIEGAPADVFASADQRTMAGVVDAGQTDGTPVPFATNTLVIIVPRGNPARVTGLSSLAESGVSVVTCAAAVPCGAATQKLFSAAGVSVTPVSTEQNVTAVLTKIAAGAADAGLVYRTDAASSPDVETVAAQGAKQVVNTYPIASLRGAGDPAVARAFVELVTGPRGRAVLDGLGFGAP